MRPWSVTTPALRRSPSARCAKRHARYPVYCADYRCSHSIAMSADYWSDAVTLSDIEPRFVCSACGFPILGLVFREWLLCLAAQERVGHWLLQHFAGVRDNLANEVVLGPDLGRQIVHARDLWIVGHGHAPSLMRAGARLVSQPPTPTGQASAGDRRSVMPLGVVSHRK